MKKIICIAMIASILLSGCSDRKKIETLNESIASKDLIIASKEKQIEELKQELDLYRTIV